MDRVDSRTFRTITLLLAAVCAVLTGTGIWLGLRFSAALGGYPVQQLLLGDYEAPDVVLLRELLSRASGEARNLFFWMYAGADMVLPAAFALLGVLLIARLAPGGRIYGMPVTRKILGALLVLPIAYAIADYAENIVSLLYFTTEAPSAWILANAPDLLPWLGRSKMALFLLTAVVIVRFFLLHPSRAGRRAD